MDAERMTNGGPNGILTPKSSTNNTFSRLIDVTFFISIINWQCFKSTGLFPSFHTLCRGDKFGFFKSVMSLQIRGHFGRFFHFSPRWILEAFIVGQCPFDSRIRRAGRRWNTQVSNTCSQVLSSVTKCAFKMLIYARFEIRFDPHSFQEFFLFFHTCPMF